MATVNVIADLTQTPLTRQDLFDAWSTATLSAISSADLSAGFLTVTVATSLDNAPASPVPGAMLWIADQQTMFCYHDEIEGTGVSLWLAVGPDIFETACLLAEPAWPGALVEPYLDRYVAPVNYTDSILDDGNNNRMIGNVHSGVPYPLNTTTPVTQESGTWVRVGIDGHVFGWIPNASGISEALFAGVASSGFGAAPVDASRDSTDMKGGLIRVIASAGRMGTIHPYYGFCGHSLYTSFGGDTASNWGQHVRYRFIGFSDQQDRTP